MSRKNCDGRGRWRSQTIAFRVSPEEGAAIRSRARLSGMTLQEYLTRRSLEQDIVVVGNPRVYKALKAQMEQIYSELRRLSPGDPVDLDLQETIRLVAEIYAGMGKASGPPPITR